MIPRNCFVDLRYLYQNDFFFNSKE